jgi:uncharacterized protein YecT (DUF1311 family)
MQILILISILLGISGVTQLRAQGSAPMIPAKWQPDLSAAIDWSASDLKDATAQMQMNSLSRNIADMKDAQLFVLYVRLYERLDAKGREQLFIEQTKWLKARTKAAQNGVESQGGSLARLESNNAEAEFTDKRITELTARLALIEKKQR